MLKEIHELATLYFIIFLSFVTQSLTNQTTNSAQLKCSVYNALARIAQKALCLLPFADR
jgi:hypothetical protein